ncbi:MAG TPA: 2-isopropylmalate synthase [Ktedonobacterales bacterium]
MSQAEPYVEFIESMSDSMDVESIGSLVAASAAPEHKRETRPATEEPERHERSDDKRVRIFDTTLRDGEQSPGASMTRAEKLEVADQLVSLGVDVIEAGFPAASPGDLASVREIARRVRGISVAGLARTNKDDIDACRQALSEAERPVLHTFIATSELHMRHKLNKTPDEVLEQIETMVAYGRRYFDTVEFSAEDATRSDWNFLTRVYSAAISAGATVINVPDTVGYTMPDEFSRLIHHLRATVPGIERTTISVHCHDDLGMATANTLAAIVAGARQAEVTINGLGERAGNTSIEEVVMALRTRADAFGSAVTRIETQHLVGASQLVSHITGFPVPPNKAIVGANAFAHEAGIHQDGMLKHRGTYEIMEPQAVGWGESRLVLGKHSGRHGFDSRLRQLGYRLRGAELQLAYREFIALVDAQKTANDDELCQIAERVTRVSAAAV